MDRCLTAPLRPLPSPTTGLPRLRDPLSRRAVPITPVDRSRCICRLLPCPCCLLRTLGGSASTTSLSRPAQALHTLRPVDSLPRQKQGLSQGFGTASYPTAPPASYRANRPLPGWDFHPQGERALRGAPEEDGAAEPDLISDLRRPQGLPLASACVGPAPGGR